ncbi:MAG: metallophosphoesterase family protein [Bacillota bacterium]
MLASIGTLLFISILGTMTFNFEALEFSLGIQIFDHGFTDLKIPPIGTVRAKTHIAPLKFTISLQNIDIKLLEGLLEDTPDKERLLESFENRIYSISKIFLVRLFILSVVGGIAGSLLLERKKVKPVLIGALIGGLIFVFLILGSISTYDINAFKNPEYKGALEAAPWMIGLAEQAFIRLDTLSQQLELMAKNFYILFEKINTLQTMSSSEGTVKVLHVSDFHNNRAALKFVSQVVKSFNVDFVIDTGDFTDYATPIETQLLEHLKEIKVPYVFIPGNHDSPAIIKKLKQIPHVIVVSESIKNIKGINILGVEDPASLTNSAIPSDNELSDSYQKRLLELWENSKENPPDIVAVHNYKIGRILAGKAELILHGHDHEYKIYQEGKSVIIDAGTTGAAGIRGLQATKEIPYTVALLHFQKSGERFHLTAVDTIRVYNLQSGFILERQVLP